MSWDHDLCNRLLSLRIETKFFRVTLDKFRQCTFGEIGFFQAGGFQERLDPLGRFLAYAGLEFGVVAVDFGISGAVGIGEFVTFTVGALLSSLCLCQIRQRLVFEPRNYMLVEIIIKSDPKEFRGDGARIIGRVFLERSFNNYGIASRSLFPFLLAVSVEPRPFAFDMGASAEDIGNGRHQEIADGRIGTEAQNQTRMKLSSGFIDAAQQRISERIPVQNRVLHEGREGAILPVPLFQKTARDEPCVLGDQEGRRSPCPVRHRFDAGEGGRFRAWLFGLCRHAGLSGIGSASPAGCWDTIFRSAAP